MQHKEKRLETQECGGGAEVVPLSRFADMTGIPVDTILRAAERRRLRGLVVGQQGGILGVDMRLWSGIRKRRKS